VAASSGRSVRIGRPGARGARLRGRPRPPPRYLVASAVAGRRPGVDRLQLEWRRWRWRSVGGSANHGEERGGWRRAEPAFRVAAEQRSLQLVRIGDAAQRIHVLGGRLRAGDPSLPLPFALAPAISSATTPTGPCLLAAPVLHPPPDVEDRLFREAVSYNPLTTLVATTFGAGGVPPAAPTPRRTRRRRASPPPANAAPRARERAGDQPRFARAAAPPLLEDGLVLGLPDSDCLSFAAFDRLGVGRAAAGDGHGGLGLGRTPDRARHCCPSSPGRTYPAPSRTRRWATLADGARLWLRATVASSGPVFTLAAAGPTGPVFGLAAGPGFRAGPSSASRRGVLPRSVRSSSWK